MTAKRGGSTQYMKMRKTGSITRKRGSTEVPDSDAEEHHKKVPPPDSFDAKPRK
jgi:hypothetical protein